MIGFASNLLIEHLNLCRIEVAQFQTANYLSGNYVGRAGQRLNSSDRADLSTGNAGHYAIDYFDELCRSQQSILAIVHRGRAGMICKAFDCDIPPVDTDDTFDDADVNLL